MPNIISAINTLSAEGTGPTLVLYIKRKKLLGDGSDGCQLTKLSHNLRKRPCCFNTENLLPKREGREGEGDGNGRGGMGDRRGGMGDRRGGWERRDGRGEMGEGR